MAEAITHGQREIVRVAARQGCVREIEGHGVAVHERGVPAGSVSCDCSPADLHVEHVLDGHLDAVASRHHPNCREKGGGEPGLPAERGMHDDGRGPHCAGELGRSLQLHEWAAAPDELRHHEHGCVDGENGELVSTGERQQSVSGLRTGIVSHHDLDSVESGFLSDSEGVFGAEWKDAAGAHSNSDHDYREYGVGLNPRGRLGNTMCPIGEVSRSEPPPAADTVRATTEGAIIPDEWLDSPRGRQRRPGRCRR